MYRPTRRSLLKGTLAGAALTVGLPLLDIFLDGNGTALASGAPIPKRFGTWIFGLGMNPDLWIPKKVGADYDLGPELKPIEAVKKHVTVLTNYRVVADGLPNFPHYSAIMGLRTGTMPPRADRVEAPSFDTLIAEQIGKTTRFRSLEVTSSGSASISYSRLGPTVSLPSEFSPVAVYQRLFGPEFVDPNAADFAPDPKITLRKSALSAVTDERKDLMRAVGRADQARLDQYFTSLRQLEDQLALQLEKPAPAEACAVPGTPRWKETVSREIDVVIDTHKLMAQMVGMALACRQTNVFNLAYTASGSEVTRSGWPMTHHEYTHQEVYDEAFRSQPHHSYFVQRGMEAWAYFVNTLASIPEGAGSLLDNCVVYAHSDCASGKTHNFDGIPQMIAGTGGGKLRNGIHIAGNGDIMTRVPFTLMQTMGIQLDRWGTKSMEVSKPVSDLFV